MKDWNVVASVQPEGYNRARRILQRWGPVERTDYFNVLVARAEDLEALLEGLLDLAEREPRTLGILGRVVPARRTFDFHSAEEFEELSRQACLHWAGALAGKSFHVRMHRRGFKGRMSSQTEEQLLDGVLLGAIEAAEAPGRITFDDPDAILAIETVGGRAGLSLWTREELARYPFLGLD
jgi:tRNA(Ser,Leu) C12 N-acetylase TAN1